MRLIFPEKKDEFPDLPLDMTLQFVEVERSSMNHSVATKIAKFIRPAATDSFPHFPKYQGSIRPQCFFSGCSGRCFLVPIPFCWMVPPTRPTPAPPLPDGPAVEPIALKPPSNGVMRYTVNHLGALEK